MDKIYKTINIGNSISRRNGLLPFVDYNSHEIKNVSDINGNYGHYVCDFGIFSEDEEGVIKEKARLKYLDVIRWYRFIDECLKKSVYVKKVIVEEEKLTKIKCDENESKIIEKETIIKFYENFKDKNKLNRIDYTALDASFFKSDGNAYIFEYPNDYFLIKEKKDSELTIEEKEFKERVDKQVNILNKDKNNFVLLQNYDSVMHFNNVWKEWWEENFKINWENIVFSGYKNYEGDFKFCYDIERYVLGKIETSNLNLNDIDEDKIPPYIYYIQLLDSNEGLFNDFLSKIEPSLWQSQKQVKDNENGLIFTYIAPVFDIPTIINSEYDSETMYDIYEYNIVKNEKEGAIKQYIPNGNLKKQWFDLSETPIKCESQLRTMQHPGAMMITDEIFGLYECFDVENPENGALFKCTYCSGTTVEPLIEVSHNATIENMGIIDAISYDTIVITEKAPTPKNEERFIVGVKEIGRNVEYKTDSEKIISYYEDNSEIEENKITTTNYYTSAITHIHYGWWECEKIPDNNNDDIKCGDDEIIKSGEKKYRNVVILSCIDNVIKDPMVGSYYYFLTRYKNGNFSPATIVDNGTIFSVGIPYKENIELNKTVYDDGTISYDTIIKKEINSVVNEDGEEIGNTITITYAKGVTSGESVNNSGILYRETFNYYPNKKEIVAIDGSYMAELYYDQIDTLTSNVIVYSEEYKLTRYTNRAEIIGLEVGTQWTEEGAIDAFLITKDGSENLSEEPKYDINLTYNRGNAAAWENHFKLSECNTMEDLKNYGNNYFNI